MQCRSFVTRTPYPPAGDSQGRCSPRFLALALFDPSAATAQKHKQIKLTEKHIQGFMGARKDMTKLYDGSNPDKPNPKVEVQAEAARKNGFASLDEYDEVLLSILMIMSGIGPQTKPIRFKENIALVLKYYNKLLLLMSGRS